MIHLKKITMLALVLSIIVIIQSFFIPQSSAAASQYSQVVSSWAETAVKTIYYYGLANDSFIMNFDKPVERQEFAALAVKMYEKAKGIRLEKPLKFEFTDINDIKYKYEVQQARNLGIVSGVGSGRFNPKGLITRQEICVMLFNLLRTIDPSVSNISVSINKFADSDKISGWAINAVNFMYNSKIVTGVGNNSMAPLSLTTREQGMVLFYRLGTSRKYINVLPSDVLSSIRASDRTFIVRSYYDYYKFLKNGVLARKCNLKFEISNFDSKIYKPFDDIDKIKNELRLSEASLYVPEYRTTTYGNTGKLDIYIEYNVTYSSGDEDILTVYDDYYGQSGLKHEKPSDLITIKEDSSLYSNVKKQIEELNGHIFIPVIGIPTASKKDEFKGLVKKILNDDPYLKWYVTGYAIKAYGYTDGIGYDIRLFYNTRLTEYQINQTNLKLKEIINTVIKPEMTDLQKESALHDYIVAHTKYDYSNFLSNTIPDESYTPYGTVVKGTAVCQGYAEALNVLFGAAGLETYIVYGEAGTDTRIGHAWNIVKIGGRYYHVDSTWDDPVPDGRSGILRTYFNLTDEQISKDHFWDRSKYPSAE